MLAGSSAIHEHQADATTEMTALKQLQNVLVVSSHKGTPTTMSTVAKADAAGRGSAPHRVRS